MNVANSHTCITSFEVLTQVLLRIQVFLDATLCCWVSCPRRFEGTCCFRNVQNDASNSKLHVAQGVNPQAYFFFATGTSQLQVYTINIKFKRTPICLFLVINITGRAWLQFCSLILFTILQKETEVPYFRTLFFKFVFSPPPVLNVTEFRRNLFT